MTLTFTRRSLHRLHPVRDLRYPSRFGALSTVHSMATSLLSLSVS